MQDMQAFEQWRAAWHVLYMCFRVLYMCVGSTRLCSCTLRRAHTLTSTPFGGKPHTLSALRAHTHLGRLGNALSLHLRGCVCKYWRATLCTHAVISVSHVERSC